MLTLAHKQRDALSWRLAQCLPSKAVIQAKAEAPAIPHCPWETAFLKAQHPTCPAPRLCKKKLRVPSGRTQNYSLRTRCRSLACSLAPGAVEHVAGDHKPEETPDGAGRNHGVHVELIWEGKEKEGDRLSPGSYTPGTTASLPRYLWPAFLQ